MGKCEISRKGRSPRELNFLRQLQICAFPQARRGAERGGVAGKAAPTAAPASLRGGRARAGGAVSPPGIPDGAREICLPAKQPGIPVPLLMRV